MKPEVKSAGKAGSRSKKKIIFLILIVFVLALFIGSAAYIETYYHADAEAISVLSEENAAVTITDGEDGSIIFTPQNPKGGLVFYPGGKVEQEAYAPLMEKIAEQGYLCVLLKVTANLAILDQNAADGVTEQFPKITDWYLGGHSLGGLVAANYLAKHPDEFDGVLLLGAYTTQDLSESGKKVLSVYGSADGVMNRENYEKYRSNLPENMTERIIEGGCHSYFGDYGMQKGDGTPTITREEQMEETAEAFAKLAGK